MFDGEVPLARQLADLGLVALLHPPTLSDVHLQVVDDGREVQELEDVHEGTLRTQVNGESARRDTRTHRQLHRHAVVVRDDAVAQAALGLASLFGHCKRQ